LVKPGNNKTTNQNVKEVSARSTQQNINLKMKCHNYILYNFSCSAFALK